jgi:PAS domain S-box-containing protein
VIDEAFRRFFLRGPHLSALCDGELRVCAASNELATLLLVPAAELIGHPLLQVLPPAPGEQPQRGATGLYYVAQLPSGERLRVRASRDGELVHALAERDEGAPGPSPLVAFGRELATLYREEDLVAALARAVRRLLPQASVCVRAVDPRTLELTSLFAEGALKAEARTRMELDADGGKLGPFEPAFIGTVEGTRLPLTAHGELQGTLEIEVPESARAALPAHEAAFRGLAGQAATALRAARAAEERRALEHYLDRLIDGGSALVAAVDGKGCLSVFNGALEEASGLRREDVLGKPVAALAWAPEKNAVEAALQAALLGAPDVTLEVHLGGSVCLFSATAVLAADGHPEGVLLVGQDLTQLKQLEARAMQAEKLATLGRLAADIAHEIVNPLTTVSMYAEAMQQGRRDEADAQKLKRIGESADRILRLARELLGYARPAREPAEPVRLDDVIGQAVRFCREAISGRKAELLLTLATPPVVVRGHRQKLTQVFVNLLTNAAQAVPLGGKIEVLTAQADGMVEARVKDDGPGMPAEVRARLFEPFFSTKPEGEGSGLGLSIVRGIVEAGEGTIEVETAEGRGTTFTVRLPAAHQASGSPPS